MTIKLVTYSWIILAVLIIVSIPALLIWNRIKNELPTSYSHYSYSITLKFSAISAVFFSIISAIIYFETKNLEITIGLFALFISGAVLDNENYLV